MISHFCAGQTLNGIGVRFFCVICGWDAICGRGVIVGQPLNAKYPKSFFIQKQIFILAGVPDDFTRRDKSSFR